MYVHTQEVAICMTSQGIAMGTRMPTQGCLHQGFRGREIQQQHGDVQIRTLRHVYGSGFAPAFRASYALREVLPMLDRSSLDKLLVDYKRGELDAKIAAAITREISSACESAAGSAKDRCH
jgi:hypothetical protein